ncbi:MAG: hypothetical protein ACFFD2_11315 [Promethearchaeota archaeon]
MIEIDQIDDLIGEICRKLKINEDFEYEFYLKTSQEKLFTTKNEFKKEIAKKISEWKNVLPYLTYEPSKKLLNFIIKNTNIKRRLPNTDPREYVLRIRKVFKFLEKVEIDYSAIHALPTEIERRRALFRYFIPDVFAPGGKYDRRADIIDGCIYYLEIIEGTKNDDIVEKIWSNRTGVPMQPKKGRQAVLESDRYGLLNYHPIRYIIGPDPRSYIPALVQRIRVFKKRKRKLDLNDFNTIVSDLLFKIPPANFKPETIKILRELSCELEKRPLIKRINQKELIKTLGMDARLSAELNRINYSILSSYEKSAFGIDTFIFQCPFPHHVRVVTRAKNSNARKTRSAVTSQWFLSIGDEYLQNLYTLIPHNERWERLYQKFPPQTRCYRSIQLPVYHEPFLEHFDPYTQEWTFRWINKKGDKKVTLQEEWRLFMETIDKSNTPIKLPYTMVNPTEELLRVSYYLTTMGNDTNRSISNKLGIPIKRVIAIRKILDLSALAVRLIIPFHWNFSDQTWIIFPGNEEWKYQFLLKIGEASAYFTLMLYEDVLNSKNYLVGLFTHPPRHGLQFIKTFTKTFHSDLEYSIYKSISQAHMTRPWYEEYFNKVTEKWEWDPNNYEITPLSFKNY